jgi:hypothetical protein
MSMQDSGGDTEETTHNCGEYCRFAMFSPPLIHIVWMNCSAQSSHDAVATQLPGFGRLVSLDSAGSAINRATECHPVSNQDQDRDPA